MSESITIEQLKDKDEYDSVVTVIRTAHAVLHEKGVDLNTASITTEEILSKLGSKGVTLVARLNKDIVGTLSISIECIRKWHYNGDCAIIRFVAVHPNHQGKHIASMLMEVAVNQASEYPVSLVTTAENNYNAIRLYRKYGYIPTERFMYNNHYCIRFSKWHSFGRRFIARLVYLRSRKRSAQRIIKLL